MASENEMSTQLQDQLARLQQLRSQLQMVIQQRQQVEIRLREVEQAMDALKKVDDDTPVFRSIGSLLIKTKGKTEVLNDLKEDKETLELRKAALDKQEGKLKEKLTEMESKVENALRLSQKA
ncbi:MAG: prefoldin subunit beta [Thermoplasmata archaeon]|nr:prefoldin subunit beta [Thermoplasmata archaeon]